jgi:nucleoside-diphosphate-sugar epimerase
MRRLHWILTGESTSAKREQVRGMDNFSTVKSENISEIADQIDFRKADLLDLSAVKATCLDVDYVLHEAAIRLCLAPSRIW